MARKSLADKNEYDFQFFTRYAYGISILGISVVIASVVCGVYAAGFLFTVGLPLPPRPRFEIPGQKSVTLSKAGLYNVYHEHYSDIRHGEILRFGNSDDLQVTVVKESTGDTLETLPPSTSFSYDFPSGKGRLIAEFEVDRPGPYLISASYGGVSDTTWTVIAVGRPWHLKWLMIPLPVLSVIVTLVASLVLRKLVGSGRILPGLLALKNKG